MVNLLYLLIGLCILGALVMIIYAKLMPTDNSTIVVSEKTALKLESLTDHDAVFSVQMPLRNIGEQDSAITDVLARPYLPQEQFPDAVCYGHVETTDRRRNDNYFEALILPAHTERMLVVTLHYVATNSKSMKSILSNMVDMDVAIYYDGVGRKACYTKKAFFTVQAVEIKALVGGAA
jgi:hypothetical protein